MKLPLTTSWRAKLAVVLVSTGFAVASFAQVDQTWINGSGTWNTTDPFWDAGAVWTNGNNGIFGGAAETVSIGSAVSVNNLTFNSDGFLIQDGGGVLTLGAASAISITGSGDSATISESLAGGGLNKQGAGTLVLSGANGFTGDVTVSAGRLIVGSNGALGDTTGVTSVVSGAQLLLGDGITVTGESLTIAGTGGSSNSGALSAGSGTSTWAGDVVVTAGGRFGALSGGELTVGGVISGGDMTVSSFGAGATLGAVTVSGTGNTYTGKTIVVRGVLRLGANDALPVGTTLNIDLSSAAEDSTFDLAGFNQSVAVLERTGSGNASGGSFVTNSAATPSIFTVDGSSSSSYDGILQDGAGVLNFVKAGTSSLTLGGDNSYTGTTTVNGGALSLTGSLSTTGQMIVNSGGVLNLNSDHASTSEVIINAGGIVNVNSAQGLGSASVGTRVNNGGYLVISTDVTGEPLTITGNGNNNGALQSAAGVTATWNGDIVMTTSSRVGGGNGGTLIINGGIGGSGGVLFSRGNNATTVLNGISTYTGDTQMFASGGSGGTLIIGVDNAISPSSRLSAISANATQAMTLDLNGHVLTMRALDTSANYSASANLSVTNNNASPATFTVSDSSGFTNFTGILKDGVGVLSVVKEGASTQTLIAANTYTGSTTVRDGILQIGNSVSTFGANGSLASPNLILQGGTLALDNLGTNNNSADRLADAAVLNFEGGTFLFRGSDQAATNSTETVGSLQFDTGISTVTTSFGGSNVATVTAGTLARPSGGGLGLVNGVNLGMDATSISSVARLLVTTTPTLVGTTDALSTGINAGARNTKIVPFLLGAVDSATGGVSTAGTTPNTFVTWEAGTGLRPLNPTDEFTSNSITTGDNIWLTADETASSATSINSLLMDGTVDLNISSSLNIASGAILMASGSSNRIVGPGDLDFGATEGLITINSGGNTFITAPITGTAGVSYFGTGTLVPGTQQSTYSGDTVLRVANVIPQASSQGPAGAPTSGAFGTGRLIFDGSNIRSTTGGPITIGNEVILRADTTILTATGAEILTFTGPVTLENGTRAINQTSTADTVFSGVIGDGGSGLGFTIRGSGTGNVVFESANTYTGPTTVSGSGLHLSDSGSTHASSTVTLDGAGARLSGTGTILGQASVVSGALMPGGTGGADAGLLSFGDSLNLGGTVTLNIDGLARGVPGGYDALDVASQLLYGGSLNLNFSTAVAQDDLFNLFNFGSASGSFTDFAFTGTYSGNLTNQFDGTWIGTIGGLGFEFTEASGTLAVVPEPSRLLLIGLGLGLAVFRRRR